ncbi:tRNA-processing ribonuclease [Brevibacterium ravenspurgense]|uniref:tRNA-processing ribonuclease n=1 Tax=Brevibacterium ravenspurgense TaxID=479117 RepID=A0A2I1IFN4_9MICO|nr:YhjD/YihY/BrkB family envelope integrity protein [Brevibacterium ravenspurgense]PKY69935.1 tRNA-processing ribonuclease [Brevibacterium ravenspurgense]
MTQLLTDKKSEDEYSVPLTARPAIAHLIRAMSRFGARLGNQFGAAITYFLVLAMIPTLMFAFSALGFFLDVVRPELVDTVNDYIESSLGSSDEMAAMLTNFISNWKAVGIVGILSALYTAQGFIGNLKDAIRSQLAADMDEIPKQSFPVRVITNVGTLIGILILTGLTIAGTVIGTGLQSFIAELFQLPGWAAPVLNIVTILLTLGLGWVLFMFIFWSIPAKPLPKNTLMLGSLFGAIALTLLLNLATVLISMFSGSPTAALFGPVIAIMLSMNLFARIILVVAAWMGTTAEAPVFGRVSEDPQAVAERENVEPPSAAAHLGALVVGTGIVAATILGLKRYEEKH